MITSLMILAPFVVADPGHEGDGHSGFATDDPSGEEDALAGFDGSGISSVEAFLCGQALAGNDFVAFFSQPHGSDPASVFFRRVGP